MEPVKIFISACEPSADKHGARLLKALKALSDIPLKAYGIGGPELVSEGIQPITDFNKLGHIGFVEVIKHLPYYIRLISRVEKSWQKEEPVLAILIDYPGMHMRLLKRAIKAHIPVVYYILPQVWAWNPSRIYTLKRAHLLLSILPFETSFYESYGVHNIEYVGNPLVEYVSEHRQNYRLVNTIKESCGNRPLLAVLPGSRLSEINNIFPVIIKAIDLLDREYCTIIVPPPTMLEHAKRILRKLSVKRSMLLPGTYLYDILSIADVAISVSGTVTLECCLFNVPQVVVYRGNMVSYWIAKKLARVRFISLVNLIAGKLIVPELIQDKCTPESIAEHVSLVASRREEILKGYEIVRSRLGTMRASYEAAKRIYRLLRNIIYNLSG